MKADRKIDISLENCPITFVRTKLELESMKPGEVLEVLAAGDEPRQNIPTAVVDHGHKVLSIQQDPDDRFRLYIKVKC